MTVVHVPCSRRGAAVGRLAVGQSASHTISLVLASDTLAVALSAVRRPREVRRALLLARDVIIVSSGSAIPQGRMRSRASRADCADTCVRSLRSKTSRSASSIATDAEGSPADAANPRQTRHR